MSEEDRLLKEAKKLPWEDRLLHKNWKVRNEANIDLAATLDAITDPKDPRIREFGPLFKKTVADSNAPVQEKALDALIAFLRAADADAGRYAKETCDAIVGKCLIGRQRTVEKSQAAFLLWIELEAVDAFLDAMEKAIKNKVAKAVVPAIDVLFQALSEFGSKIVSPKRVLKMLPELFDHPDQNVRSSSKGLTLELCRWIGKDPVKSILFEKMRDTMKKELESELPNVIGTARPSRKVRSEQDKEPEPETVSDVAGSVQSQECVATGIQEIDEYELLDPVDILMPLDKTMFWSGVKASKWSERRDAVAELTQLASTKRIAPGDFSEVCRTLKKLVTDVNLAVAVESIQAIGNLARGLRNHFSTSSRFLLPILLEKLKEKRPTLAEALIHTLQEMHKAGCVTLVDIIEDVRVSVKNKVPIVRALSLNWLSFCIESSNKSVVLKVHKDYVSVCMECLADGTPDVRDAAFSTLTALAKSVGMKLLERSLEKLDDVRRKKLSEMITGTGVSSSLNTNSATNVQNISKSMTSLEMSEGISVRRSAASMLSGKRPVPAAQGIKAGSKKLGSTKRVDGTGKMDVMKPIETHEEIEPNEMSLEEIENRIGSLVSTDTLSLLKSTVWKERLEAISSLKEQVEGLEEIDRSVEILISLLCVVPGWAEKIVQVQQQAIEVISYLASTAKRFPKKCVVLCLVGVSERVADIKTRTHAMKCLTTFSEAVGPGFVFERLQMIMKDHKNPKVLSEGLLWMVSAIDDFGVSNLNLKELFDFCKDVGLQSSAAATRNATVKLLGVVHKFVGPDMKTFLGDVKPALLSAIDAEFEKNLFKGAAAVPKKTVRAVESVSSSSSSGQDVLPREDISVKVTPTLLKNLESQDWKVRLEAIESINRILEEANRRILPPGTGDLFAALRARLYDSNKNLVMAALMTIGGLASSIGPSVEKSSKGILFDVLKCLGDNKKHMRECALSTLDCWVAAVDLEKVVPCITTMMADSKVGVEGRKDIFDWLSKQLSGLANFSDAAFLLKPAASAMMDKSSEVRKAAETCITEIIRVLGHETVEKNLKDLRGPALTFIVEQLKVSGSATHDLMEAARAVSIGPVSRTNMKSGKSALNNCSKQVLRTSTSRSITTKAPRLEMIPSVQDIAIQSQSLISMKDSCKEDRERMVVRKFKFEELRIEQIQDIENDMMKYVREDLCKLLCSSDFRKQIQGLDMLLKALPSILKNVIEILDVLLKWFVLQFSKSNTTCLLKVLEFLPVLFDMLRNEAYSLTETEATIFFPCLIEKMGHNIERVRDKIRELAKQIVSAYPAAKFYPFILESLRSKNNRTRIECVDFIGYLIDFHVTEISGQLKSLHLVANLMAERDGEIRKAALNTLATGYKILGEDIWRYLGKLPDPQKSMLDDRFRWKVREMEKNKEGKPGEARATLRRLVRKEGFDIAEQNHDVTSSVVGSVFERNDYGERHHPQFERHAKSYPLENPINQTDWNDTLDVIFFGSFDESIEGMKVVCHKLRQANDAGGHAIEELENYADGLVSCLANKVSKTFSVTLTGTSSRPCKYVLNTLMQTFQNRQLAHSVKDSTLEALIAELLVWLLDERVSHMDDGGQLLRALNVLMFKILDTANRTSSFVVLINLLCPLDSSRWPAPPTTEIIGVRNHKFSELVVKCLIKITKVLQSTIHDVDLDRIIQSIHLYLQDLGMEEVKRRTGADDKPLRMVKTIIHELTKLCGAAIKGHLSLVPLDMNQKPLVLSYIDLNLETLAAARMLTSAAPVGQTNWTDSEPNNPSPPSHCTDAQLKQELAGILKKIGDKQTCAVGLCELYRITQLYPKVDISSQLQNASEAFRTYIKDGLAEVALNAAAGKTSLSLSVSTPPPSSQFEPISAIYTSSLSDSKLVNTKSTTFVPQSHIEDKFADDVVNARRPLFENSLEQKIVQSSTRATSGALDAIRERMKSMQLATSGPNSGHPSLDDGHPQNAHPADETALLGLHARMERLKSGSIDSSS